MKRDEAYIRELLFRYEAEEDWLLFVPGETMGSSEEEWRERYHVYLMIDAGLLAHVSKDTMRLTSAGHDFLEAIRSDTIWKQVQDGAARMGGVTLGILKDLAVAYIKQEVASRLGVAL